MQHPAFNAVVQICGGHSVCSGSSCRKSRSFGGLISPSWKTSFSSPLLTALQAKRQPHRRSQLTLSPVWVLSTFHASVVSARQLSSRIDDRCTVPYIPLFLTEQRTRREKPSYPLDETFKFVVKGKFPLSKLFPGSLQAAISSPSRLHA